MNGILGWVGRLSRLTFKAIFQMIAPSSAEKTPQIVLRQTGLGIFSGFPNDVLMQQSSLVHGTREPHFDALAQVILKPTDVVLDIGGNIGTHAIYLSRLVSKGKVYTFEPQSLVFSILQNNLLLNSCKNVTAYRFAISNDNHKVAAMEPFSFEGEIINNGALRVDRKENLGDYVLTRTIDSFSFGEVAFMKLDIQGSEVRALEGARSLISESRPYMFVEVEEQHLRALGTCTQELIELVFSLGYAMYRIEIDYPCDHICVPVEKTEYFETHVLPKLPFSTSSKIFGSDVEVIFRNPGDQNYARLVVSHGSKNRLE
jgi:FkbM family methyltransferase